MDPSSVKTIILPRLLTKWPWVRTLSEHYEECKAESWAWIESFHPFEGRGREEFEKCDFSLLAALTYAPRDKSIIRFACDFMYLYFIVVEYTDVEDRAGVERIHQRLKTIFNHQADPSTIQTDDLLSRIAKDFWIRARVLGPEDAPCVRRFCKTWNAYTAAIIIEAEDRSHRRLRSFKEHMELRLHTAAVINVLISVEFGLDVPEEVYYHPVLSSLRHKAALMAILTNDIYSYVREKSLGLEIHNGVEVLMHELELSIQQAMDWLGRYCDELEESFLRDLAALPSWGPNIDPRVSAYVSGIGQWVRGFEDWSSDTQRYFGSQAAHVRETRIATLVPPTRGYANVPPARSSL